LTEDPSLEIPVPEFKGVEPDLVVVQARPEPVISSSSFRETINTFFDDVISEGIGKHLHFKHLMHLQT
jgi:hypothetical protein